MSVLTYPSISLVATPTDSIPQTFETGTNLTLTISWDFTRLLSFGESIDSYSFYISNPNVSLLSSSVLGDIVISQFTVNLALGQICFISCVFSGSSLTVNGRTLCIVSTTQSSQPVIPGGFVINSQTKFYELIIPGTLGIGVDLAANLYIPVSGYPKFVSVRSKNPPEGSSLIVSIYQGASLFYTATIPSGQSIVTLTNTQIQTLPQVQQGLYWRVDVVSVGSTFPGSDLLVTIGA